MSCSHKKYWPLFIVGGIALFFIVGFIVQLLWNATISVIFDVQNIGYWQAIMILILSKILFSSHHAFHKKHKTKVIKHRPLEVEES